VAADPGRGVDAADFEGSDGTLNGGPSIRIFSTSTSKPQIHFIESAKSLILTDSAA
jgi:hypothetical protein